MLVKGRVQAVYPDRFKLKMDKGAVTIYVSIPVSTEGAEVEAQIEMKNGRFILLSFEEKKDKQWVLNYLQSIKGIGPKTAEKMYQQHGDKVVELIKDPQFLSQYTKHQRDTSLDGFERVYGILRKAVGEKRAKKALEYISKNKEEFYNNPYILLNLSGFGFKTVDPIALEYIPKNSPLRVKEFIRYYLQQQADRGHTYIDVEEIKKAVKTETGSDQLYLSDDVEIEGNRVYLKQLKKTEEDIATSILELRKFDHLGVRHIEPHVQLTPEQVNAVEMALSQNLLVITGYAGTGKTTVAKTVLAEFEDRGLDVELLAPTGKAAKRLEEVTGKPASTIHRALFYGLTGDVLMVDEASMIDIFLAKQLLREARGKRVIFIGDPAQLPPVGTGHFFRDIINSGEVPVASLTQVMRNAGGIVRNANAVREGRFPKAKDDNFHWFAEPEKRVEQLLKKAKEKGKELQLLGGVYKGKLGVERLNKLAQEILNPENEDKQFQGFRLGDRVIHTGRNDYENFVMNGDSGQVVEVGSSYLTVKFWDGKEKTYTAGDLQNLQLAYAMTVHKAQGSEWENVAVVFDTASYPLLSRYWLYTALTRAKDKCFLFADKKPVAIAVKNSAYPERKTFLKEQLKKSFSLKP